MRRHRLICLLGIILLIDRAHADCLSSYPYTAPCSGFGECLEMNTTAQFFCQCYDGWTGRNDFFNREASDCVTNLTARTVLLALCYIFAVLALVATLYRLFTFRPLSFTEMFFFNNIHHAKYLVPKRFCSWALLEQAAVVAYCTILLCPDTYHHRSVAAVVSMCIFVYAGLAKSTFITVFQVKVALANVSTRQTHTRVILRNMHKLLLVNAIVGSVIATVGLLANLISTDEVVALAFWRVVLGASILTSWISVGVLLQSSNGIIKALREHISNSPSGYDTNHIKKAISKLRPIQINGVVVYGVVSCFPFAVAIIPSLMSYFVPSTWSLIAISSMSTVLGFSPAKVAQESTEESTRSGVTLPTVGSSTTALSSASNIATTRSDYSDIDTSDCNDDTGESV